MSTKCKQTKNISNFSTFREGIASIPEDMEKKMHSFQELKSTLYKIRFPTFLVLYYMTAQMVTHTSITALVVSEQHDENTSWACKFSKICQFVPLTIFVFSELFWSCDDVFIIWCCQPCRKIVCVNNKFCMYLLICILK